MRSQLKKIEDLGAAMEEALILDNKYTEHSTVGLAQQWDQLDQLGMRMQHNLEQQIQARYCLPPCKACLTWGGEVKETHLPVSENKPRSVCANESLLCSNGCSEVVNPHRLLALFRAMKLAVLEIVPIGC